MTADYPCECKHPKARHHGGTYWCLDPDCDCKRYTPDFKGQVHQAVEAAYEAGDSVLGESTSARLRRVEQERDELAVRNGRLAGQLNNALECFDQLQSAAGTKYQAYEAELASARTELEATRIAARHSDDLNRGLLAELEQLRYSGWIVARDGGRECAGCGQEIRRGEAYSVDTTGDVLRHVHCREKTS
jgi:hypothetical protein